MNAAELLANTLSPNAHTRDDATQKLESASRENYPAYMLMLSSELVNESSPVHVRNAAGLSLKSTLSAREIAQQTHYVNRWLALDDNTSKQVGLGKPEHYENEPRTPRHLQPGFRQAETRSRGSQGCD